MISSTTVLLFFSTTHFFQSLWKLEIFSFLISLCFNSGWNCQNWGLSKNVCQLLMTAIYSVKARQLVFMENNIKSELIYRETLWVQVFIRKYIYAAQCLGSLFVRRSNLSFYKNVLKIDFWHRESWDYFS